MEKNKNLTFIKTIRQGIWEDAMFSVNRVVLPAFKKKVLER